MLDARYRVNQQVPGFSPEQLQNMLMFLKLPAHRCVQDDDAYNVSDIDPRSTM